MSRLKYKWLAALFLFVAPFCAVLDRTESFAQSPYGNDPFQQQDPFGNNISGNLSANPFMTDNAQQDTTARDTTKKERKPLESYFFDNETRAQKNFAWNIDMSKNRIRMTTIDTLLTDFQVDYPFLKKGVGDAYLGNLGAPSVPLAYYDRPVFRDFQMA